MPKYGTIHFWPAFSLLVILAAGPGSVAFGQVRADSVKSSKKEATSGHSPQKALIMAAILPGSGQAYNRKYWKIPVVYTGYVAAGYFFSINQSGYKSAKQNYIYETDKIDSTVNQSGKSAQVLLSEIDNYRRMRDISVLALLAWHGLTIIDANVDAHFFNWDVSEDLSMALRPRAIWTGFRSPGIGMSVVFNLK